MKYQSLLSKIRDKLENDLFEEAKKKEEEKKKKASKEKEEKQEPQQQQEQPNDQEEDDNPDEVQLGQVTPVDLEPSLDTEPDVDNNADLQTKRIQREEIIVESILEIPRIKFGKRNNPYDIEKNSVAYKILHNPTTEQFQNHVDTHGDVRGIIDRKHGLFVWPAKDRIHEHAITDLNYTHGFDMHMTDTQSGKSNHFIIKKNKDKYNIGSTFDETNTEDAKGINVYQTRNHPTIAKFVKNNKVITKNKEVLDNILIRNPHIKEEIIFEDFESVLHKHEKHKQNADDFRHKARVASGHALKARREIDELGEKSSRKLSSIYFGRAKNESKKALTSKKLHELLNRKKPIKEELITENWAQLEKHPIEKMRDYDETSKDGKPSEFSWEHREWTKYNEYNYPKGTIKDADHFAKLYHKAPVKYLEPHEWHNMGRAEASYYMHDDGKTKEQKLANAHDHFGHRRDVTSIAHGIEHGKIPYPIVLQHKGRHAILGGNTRSSVAAAMGKNLPVKVINLDDTSV